MRSQNIKLNSFSCSSGGMLKKSSGKAGGVSCLLLLLLTFLAVNPFIGMSAYAEGSAEEQEDATEQPSANAVSYDGQAMTYAETPSTVTISFQPTSANGSVTPVNAGGDKAKVDVKATVRVQNSGGYSVYVGNASTQLKNGSNVIDSVSSATTYAALPVNSWGYAFIKNGASSTDATQYDAMPATLRSTPLDSNTSTSITDETRTYTLSFAANIGNDKPAGKYTNSVTMSIVSSPLTVAEEVAYSFDNINTMQQMTSAICSKAPTGGVKQLKDERDGKYYWIGKMKDGKCWMTQNLDLDLNEKTLPLTSATSDVSADWTPKDGDEVLYTANTLNSSTTSTSNTGQRSWSLGDYSIINPTSINQCVNGLENVAGCSGNGTADRFKYYVTPTMANGDTNAHYILGNYYQWNAATAGTGSTTEANKQAPSSICPKGWKLPTSNDAIAGSFDSLVSTGEIGNNVTKLVSAPYYFVRGGVAYQQNFLEYLGYLGLYWSSTPNAVGGAYNLQFFGTTSLNSAYDKEPGQNGNSVRCIAK